jgi:plastocyanin
MNNRGKLLLAAVFLPVVILMVSCSSDSNPTDSGNNDGNTSANSVAISNFAFSPTSLTVKVGTKVTWTNNDNAQHNVTSDDGGFESSGNLSKGQTYLVTFSTAGSYPYHCSIHPSMTGTIVVTE